MIIRVWNELIQCLEIRVDWINKYGNPATGETVQSLMGLGDRPTAQTLNAVLEGKPKNRKHFARNTFKCDNCSKQFETVLRVGHPFGYENQARLICALCLLEGFKMLEES